MAVKIQVRRKQGSPDRGQSQSKERNVRLLASLSLWALVLSVQAADWTLLTTSTDLKKVTYWYVDNSSVVSHSKLIKAQLRTAWSQMQFGPDNTGYLSTTYISYVDCNKRLLAYTANTYFSDFESTSEPVHQEPELPLTELNFAPPRAGTPGEMRINYLCKSYDGASNNSI